MSNYTVNAYNNGGTGGSVNMRSGPSTNYSVIVQVPHGATVTGNKSGTWSYMTYGSYSGYMMSVFLDEQSGGSSGSSTYLGTGTVTGGSLNCRKQPSTGSTAWGQFQNGTTIPIYTCDTSGWYETRWPASGSNIGYVMSQYVSMGGNTSGLFYGRVVVSNGTLNVRKTIGGQVIGQLPNNRIIICEDIGNSSWCKTRYKGSTAYVSSSFITAITTPTVHSTYPARCNYIYTPEIGQTNASYFDNASGQWCQLFVNWLLRAAYVPSNRVPSTGNTGEGIEFWVKNASFYFKSATWKGPLNTRYSLGVGSTLTIEEQNYVPVVGDIIYLRWSNAASNVYVSHTGFVTSVSGSTVYTVEGNADSALYNNVGRVATHSYSISDSQIIGYGKPNYSI